MFAWLAGAQWRRAPEGEYLTSGDPMPTRKGDSQTQDQVEQSRLTARSVALPSWMVFAGSTASASGVGVF
jgi:hypothetical protein